MIIALSGKISVGKDLVAKIIQSITSGDRIDKVEDVVINNWIDPYTPWEVRKFADKLKDIVCIMIGCRRSQLEDRDFKEKELGEEWWYYVNSFGAYVPYVGHTLGNTSNLVKPTPRLFMQLVGTECGLSLIHI